MYNFIRHPGYLGGLLIFLGLSTALSNWLSILLKLIPITFGYVYRIYVEERFLVEQFGQKFIDYQKRTKRLIPYIF
jgi:protein-S-isoprenylcysteine O-methyltransferase Ste14